LHRGVRNERADGLLGEIQAEERGNQMVRGFPRDYADDSPLPRHDAHPQVRSPMSRARGWILRRGFFCGRLFRISSGRKTVLLTTHNMEEAEALCQRLAIVDHGRRIRVGHARGVEGDHSGGLCCGCDSGIKRRVVEKLEGLSGVREVASVDPQEWILCGSRGIVDF